MTPKFLDVHMSHGVRLIRDKHTRSFAEIA